MSYEFKQKNHGINNQMDQGLAMEQIEQQRNPYYGQNFGFGAHGIGIGQNQQYAGMNQPQNIGQNPYYRQNMRQNYGYTQNYTISPRASIFGETPSDKLLRGLLIGGVATYILTNENAQKAIIKTGVKLFGSLVGGIEEFKEKIMDAKAEIEAEKEEAAE